MQYGMSAMCSDAAAALVLITRALAWPMEAASQDVAAVLCRCDDVAEQHPGRVFDGCKLLSKPLSAAARLMVSPPNMAAI